MHKERFIEIDVLRGLAIVGVVIFHLFFDLDSFNIISNSMYAGAWLIFVRWIQFTFLSLVGVTLYLVQHKYSVKNKPQREIDYKIIKHGLYILAWGMVITVVTWFYSPIDYVKFGILHFIGAFIIISPLFIKRKKLITFSITIILLAWYLFQYIHLSHNMFFILGLTSPSFASLDYFPFIPWALLPLTGIVAGELFCQYYHLFQLHPKHHKYISWIALLGKKSLFIYLIHQPILIGVIYLLRNF